MFTVYSNYGVPIGNSVVQWVVPGVLIPAAPAAVVVMVT